MTELAAHRSEQTAGLRTYFRMGLASVLTVPLFFWLVYCVVVSVVGALTLIIVGFKASWAVGGIIGVFLCFGPFLFLCVISPFLYLGLLNALPPIWTDTATSTGRKIGSTVITVVTVSLVASGAHWVGTRAVGWVADLNPCASYAAGVTGSKSVENCAAP
ncbi:hypothetical protein [Caulobacter sp. DWR2-3-1b2]|uniref:hypothetical protein n=1 Tax=unclassified Caulobacter TaxID=2648921 RepID=UPI003CEC42E2